MTFSPGHEGDFVKEGASFLGHAVGVGALPLDFPLCSKPSPLTTIAGTNTTVTGTVVERLDGPPYSYLRLAPDKGEIWVAVPMAEVKKGGKVTIKHGAALKNFSVPRSAGSWTW